ncbi:unnamed protein product [Allacma fusca]|uniref:Innexin n=1 Tax=Allacma fusca TaxID=39272 RepID=A0A8J2KUK9_9HEXA|nr:unnamed protein product [Allacma fusca]
MDPNAVGSLFQTYRNYFKRGRNHTVIVSPSLWLSCYLPFGVCLLTSFYTGWFETNGNRFECLEVMDFTINRVNTECFYESFTIPKLKELPVVQPVLFCCGFLFLLPLILWKYFIGGRAVFEVTATLEEELTVIFFTCLYNCCVSNLALVVYTSMSLQSRNEDYQLDANRKLKVFLDSFEVNYRRRHTLWLSMLVCKIITPVVPFIVGVCLLKILGEELKWYGLTAFQWPTSSTSELVSVDALFPIMVQCGLRRFQMFGPLTEFETTCYYPRNSLYRIVFVVLWWLFVVNVIFASVSALFEMLMYIDAGYRQQSARKFVPTDLWEPLHDCVKKMDIFGYVYFMLVLRNVEPGKIRRVIFDVLDVI